MPDMSYRPPKHIQVPMTTHIEKNQRFAEENIHGDFIALATGETLATGDDITTTTGIGKFVIVVNAGSDTAGTITITGTSVNRDTGAETGSDTDNITLTTTTTDASDTDAEGHARHDITGGYISSKWFHGAVTISTTTVDLSDVDVYQCSFEQLNDQPDYWIETLDINAKSTNASAWLYSYLYSVIVSGSRVNIAREATIGLAAADVVADKYYRLRRAGIDQVMDGSTDGFFLDLFFGPASQTYWEDVTIKVWTHVKI